jgi:hypothetical protein
MSISLNQSLIASIHNQTDNQFFGKRVFCSIRTISQKKGYLAGAATGVALSVSAVYTLAFSYFLLEGSVRSLIDVYHDHSIVGLRPLGDAGGWTGLGLFSVLALGNLCMRVIRESEYIRIKSICRNWVEANKMRIRDDRNFHQYLYSKINNLLDAFQSQCLFSESLASRRLIALDTCQSSDLEAQDDLGCGSKFAKDKELQTIFQKIHQELQDASKPKQYCNIIHSGQQSIKQTGGHSRQLGSLILGIAIPIILLSCAILSFVGEFGLGKELFIDKEGLTDVGHFGEWPFNAVEMVGVAFLLHLWVMINEGDFTITRKIYAKHIECSDKDCSLHKCLQEDTKLRNRLCTIANEELAQGAVSCHYFKSLGYQFEKT